MAVPSIRLIVPTPDVSHADTDPNASTSVSISPGRVPSKKKSALGLLSGSVSAMQGQTPYNTTRDFSDIVRRVGGGDSVTGRGWEVRVEPEGSVRSRGGDGTWGNAETQEGEGMVLIKKKVKTRGRVDGVFADVTNNAAPARSTTPTPHAIESGRESRQEGAKDKWWNLTRGRKDTGGKDGSVGVLGFVRRGKSPGPNPSLPPTPTVEFHPPAQTRVRQPQDAQRQMYLPGEPDCTLDMVEVPSVRGRAIMKDLPQPPQPFPAQKRFNSLGASSALAPAPQARVEYQRSVSAGSAVLLTQSKPQYAHLPGASAPYATMTRVETYQQPATAKSIPPRSPPQQKLQQHQQQHHPMQFQRSASAMAVYGRGDTAEFKSNPAAPPKPSDFKRSASALVGSGILLGAPASTLGRAPTPTPLSRAPTPVPGPRSGTPTAGGLLAPPGAPGVTGGKDKEQGSIAIRAMRSVRSMARLGTWDREEKEGEKEKERDGEAEGTVRGKKIKVKVKEEKKVKAEKKKGKEEKEKKEKGKRAPKSSLSSFEVGALGASPVQRKRSILGLGLGSTLGKGAGVSIGMGLPSALSIGRSASGGKASTASSVGGPAFIAHPTPASLNPNRLSAESAGNPRRESTNSSLRPLSVLSSGSSAGSRVSSGSSVRWAEEVVDRVRGRDRGERKEEKEKEKQEKKERKEKERESRRTSEGRRRTPLSDVFPGLSRRSSGAESANSHAPPMLTVEEATTDGHGHDDDEANVDYEIVSATPVKRPRPRPVSDDMLHGGKAKSRPRGIIEDSVADGVLTLLDAATNDLAQLITHLDLEATPGTPSPGRGPIVPRKEWEESPTSKSKTLRPSMGSVSSLRPYAAREGSTAPKVMLGQQIAPWPTHRDSPPAPTSATTVTDATFKRMHRRTMTPTPEPDPEPVFHPLRLRPSRIRPPLSVVTNASASPPPPSDEQIQIDMRAPSSLTFGSRSSSGSVEDTDALRARGLPPVFTRGHGRNRSSLLPDAPSPKSSQGSARGMPLARETKRVLGMGGTMGGSAASGYEEQELDASDPDSDIPNELQAILSSRGQSPVDDTLSFRLPSVHTAPLPSPGLPPHAPLPVSPSPSPSLLPPQFQLPVLNIQLIDDDGHHGDDEGAMSSEEDTKKSFDFTGELQKLNESGGSDRRSFVEQLEHAFKTPAKLDLRNLLCVDVPPPMPAIPVTLTQDTSDSSSEQMSSDFQVPQSVSRLVDMREPTMATSSSEEADSMDVDVYSGSRIVDLKEPTLLPGSDSLGSDDSLVPPRPFTAGPSDGQLNVKFKFGGELPAEEKQKEKPKQSKKPLTLSDIIPPPSHVRAQSLSSLLEEDDSVLKSIFLHAADIPRPRVNSDSSARRFEVENSRNSMMSMHSRTRSRPQSGISFTGFDSFEEVRRGFEFHHNRPAFYPPPVASNRRVPHARQDSLFSIASVSSYGHVTNPGTHDPFEYGLPMPSLRERPSSEDLSVSMSGLGCDNDTFEFLARDPHRKRVASDASSFYFKAPGQPSARGHNRRESNMSVSSQGPPVSFYNYNRSYGNHRLSENDTSTSGSSLAHQYAAYGANGGRAAWAKHRQDSSVDSVMSDYSVARLGRPGVGDKMFNTAMDHGMPLRAISASPPESRNSLRNRSSFDSIIDEERRSSMEDSLFEKTGHRSSMSSDSVFGYDDHHPPNGHLLPPHQFRPLSVLSFNNSAHSPMKEDDTMISMLGGGHVRRRSIGSVFEASPCVRAEKRKHVAFQEDEMASNKARIVTTKPSIASTSSSKFGGERMIKARQGLLVRQSLEESCLIAAGEDMSLRPAPVFSRPSPNSRSRSSTITTSSSGGDTPPLSSAEGSSMSDGSQSSIDMSQINVMLSNATHPMASTARDRVRARARGQGHRRRMSAAQSRASRSSVYETIQEEFASPAPSTIGSKKSSSPTACQGVFISTGSVDLSADGPGWDDERGIMALRRYYALRHEAEDTVTESRRMWSDTPFSLYALQAFSPPKNPEGMQALLQHSVQNYGPLPSELGPRRVRSRTQSRASPYPRQAQSASSPEQPQRPSPAELHRVFVANNTLQAVEVNSNVDVHISPAMPSPKRENAWGLAPNARPRVASAARRTALGWAKRSTKASSDLKENNTSMSGVSFMMTPGESLRISRPRPRGRPTPARAGVPTPRQAIPTM